MKLNILISLNRFAAIIVPGIYYKLWTNRLTYCILFGVLATAIVASAPIFFYNVGAITTTGFDEGKGSIVRTVAPAFLEINSYFNDLWKRLTYANLAVCVTCYPVMLFKVSKASRRALNQKLQLEVRLLYSVLVLFVTNIIYAAYFLYRDIMIARYGAPGRSSEWLIYLLADIYDMHNVYGILFTSREIRQAVFGLQKCTPKVRPLGFGSPRLPSTLT